MMMKRFLSGMLALVLVAALAAPGLASSEASSKEITVRGVLRPTVEAGGWVIVSGEQKYLLLNFNRFKNESWFREGAEVEAVGETKNVATIYMEGTPFEARTLRPFASGASGGGAGVAERSLTRVTVSGESIVQAQPDTAIISIAVITENKSASEAQAENASRSEAVVRAIKAAAGAGAEVKTGGYSLQPQYHYSNGPPQLTGYQARNTVIVTMSDLTKVGQVIDAASRAGANNVDGLSFTLRRDRPARNQALTQATQDAVAKARIIAEALGGRVVRVVEVQEGAIYRPPVPMPVARGKIAEMAADSAQTPIEIGSLDVRMQVQLVAEIEN